MIGLEKKKLISIPLIVCTGVAGAFTFIGSGLVAALEGLSSIKFIGFIFKLLAFLLKLIVIPSKFIFIVLLILIVLKFILAMIHNRKAKKNLNTVVAAAEKINEGTAVEKVNNPVGKTMDLFE